MPLVHVCLFTDNSLLCLEVRSHSEEPLLLEYEKKIRHLWNYHVSHQANLIYRNLIQNPFNVLSKSRRSKGHSHDVLYLSDSLSGS